MNVSKTAVYLLLPLLVTVIVPGHVWGQSDAPGTKLRRVIPSDTETMVSSASRWRYHEGEGQRQCSPNGIPALELVTPPQHATVRFVFADLGVPKGSGCINSVYGKAVFIDRTPDSSARIDLPTMFQLTRWHSSTSGALQGRGRCSLLCATKINARGSRHRPAG